MPDRQRTEGIGGGQTEAHTKEVDRPVIRATFALDLDDIWRKSCHGYWSGPNWALGLMVPDRGSRVAGDGELVLRWRK
jgi:hypothetical protein